MKDDSLSPLININDCLDIEEIIDKVYIEFKKVYMDRENKPKELLGKRLIIEFANWKEFKADIYWHLISLGEKEKFNVFPCGNKLSNHICSANCIYKKRQIVRYNGDIRNICIYRALRIIWPINIIELANKRSYRIIVWEKDNKLYLRYNEGKIDYIVVFASKRNTYKLISAFPVFYINKKISFDNDYKEYMKIKKSQ